MDQIRGGFGQTEDATADVQDICAMVKTLVERGTNQRYETFEAEKYRSQVVQGLNYLIKVNVGHHGYIHLEVYQSLSREIQLNGVKPGLSKDDPLKLPEEDRPVDVPQSQLPATSF